MRFAIFALVAVGCGGETEPLRPQRPLPPPGAPPRPPIPSPTPPPCPLCIPRPPNADIGTSHGLQYAGVRVDHHELRQGRGDFYLALAYGDFNQDGVTDIFYSPGGASGNAMPPELFAGDGVGGFTFEGNAFDAPGLIHARKALPGDFNADGVLDVFVLGHGDDSPAGPGEAPYALLSSSDGYHLAPGLEEFAGFLHGGATADIDADGDLDVFVTDSSNGSFFLVNDGTGTFTMSRARLGEHIAKPTSVLTAELVDLNGDRYTDLLVAGGEHQGFATRILWGNRYGWYGYLTDYLPAVYGYGVVVDIDAGDLNGDGYKDLLVTRTGDGTEHEFYEGYHLQLLLYVSGRAGFRWTTLDESVAGEWIPWIRLWDLDGDGDLDILADDHTARNLAWINDGSGSFAPP
ncbi:FG-GAP repeat domain-containing protein [Candidatus Palauibacter sp.]|uniref:FG-GAP repeat domain-containing protein n=1 Tax=Candidatus Palauibacter sp. TaxID=3101350 RepID=UPI003B01DDAF